MIFLKRKIKFILLFISLMIVLTGCRSVKLVNAVSTSMEEYSLPKTMILIAEEKNKYESRFGHDIWKLKSGDGSQSFSSLIVSNVKKFVENIITINMLGDKYNVEIDNDDKRKISDLAGEYYQTLTAEDKNFIGCEEKDVESLYTDFHKARLTIDHVTKNADVELSISESKVIKVQYIEFEDEVTAYEVASKSQLRGANFAYYAKQYTKSKDNIERIVMRGDDFSKPFPEIFYLGNGEKSEVLRYDNKFYLFKCIDDYMEDETNKRKEDILKQLKENAFEKEYQGFAIENPVKLNSDYWQKIDLNEGVDSTTNKFYDLYYKYFPLKEQND